MLPYALALPALVLMVARTQSCDAYYGHDMALSITRTGLLWESGLVLGLPLLRLLLRPVTQRLRAVHFGLSLAFLLSAVLIAGSCSAGNETGFRYISGGVALWYYGLKAAAFLSLLLLLFAKPKERT